MYFKFLYFTRFTFWQQNIEQDTQMTYLDFGLSVWLFYWPPGMLPHDQGPRKKKDAVIPRVYQKSSKNFTVSNNILEWR